MTEGIYNPQWRAAAPGAGSWDPFLFWDRKEAALGFLPSLFSLVSEKGGPSRPPREGGKLTRAHSVAELGCDFRAHHYPAWGSFTSANWQFPHTKSSLIRASVDSWSANGWPQLSLHLIFPHLQRRKPTSWFLSSRTQQPCNHPDCSPLVIYPLCLLPSPIVFSLLALGTVFQTTAIFTWATCLYTVVGKASS